MKYTNTKNLPGLLVNAIKNENAKYSRGKADCSTTQLIDAPIQKILKEKHSDEIVEDVSDRLWSFFGSMGHAIISEINSKDVILKEERFYTEVLDWTVSGQPDLYYENDGEKVLCDFKITSNYATKNGAKSDYIKQLNIYRYMLEEHNFPIDRMEIIAIIRDAAMYEERVKVLPVKKFKLYKVKEYMEGRVALHKLYASGLPERIPECTPAERWQAPPKYCLMKEGNTSQTGRDYATDDEAVAFLEELTDRHPDDKYYIKRKLQRNKRCEGYCSVSKFCWWWQLPEDERPDSHKKSYS